MRNQKGFTFVEFLIVLAILGIIVAAIPGFLTVSAAQEFQKEFGFDRATPTPELYKSIAQEHLDQLCTQYEFLQHWADEAWLALPEELDELSPEKARTKYAELGRLAQVREHYAQQARERYSRAYEMITDQGWVVESDPSVCRLSAKK